MNAQHQRSNLNDLEDCSIHGTQLLMNDQLPDISDAEWRVMNVVWQHTTAQQQRAQEANDEFVSITARTIIQRLQETTEWTAGTIKTLLHRLVQKGALDFQRKGKKYLYRATVTQFECIDRASSRMLYTVFNGRPIPMITYLVETARLSGQEVETLSDLLDDIRKKLPPHSEQSAHSGHSEQVADDAGI